MASRTATDDPEHYFATEPWCLGVIGLGYVGLPLLVTASQRGLRTVGFDTSDAHVRALAGGTSVIDDVSDESLQAALAGGSDLSNNPEMLRQADAIIVCVPSPLSRDRQPDMSFIESAATTISEVARPGQLVSLESTTYPGTTSEYLLPAVEKAGLELDTDVWVAYSPERVSPGDPMKTGDIPKVVGGVTPRSTAVAVSAYRRIVASVHAVSSARVAEMAKLLENTYRAVNIGLINEIAQLADALDIDIWEVIEAAATKPFGFEAHWPGPGVGGHCIPLDPQYLAWRAREANFVTRFINLTEQVNSQMPQYTATRIARLLDEQGLATEGAEILVIGIAYKRNVADDRESASLQVIDALVEAGARVAVMDPHVGTERISRLGLTPIESGEDLSRFAIAVILTDHDRIDYMRIADEVPVVFDTRDVYRRIGLERANVTTL